MKLETVKKLKGNNKHLRKLIRKQGVEKVRRKIIKAYSKEIKAILMPSEDLSILIPLLADVNPVLAIKFKASIENYDSEVTEEENLKHLLDAADLF